MRQSFPYHSPLSETDDRPTNPVPQVLSQRLVEAVASGDLGAAEAEDLLSAGIYCSMAACFQSSVIRQARQAQAVGQMGEGDEAPGVASGPRINPIMTFVRL